VTKAKLIEALSALPDEQNIYVSVEPSPGAPVWILPIDFIGGPFINVTNKEE